MIFPNPAKEFLIIRADNFENWSGCAVYISNILGVKVYLELIRNQVTKIDLNTLKPGLYNVTIISPDNKIFETRKILIE